MMFGNVLIVEKDLITLKENLKEWRIGNGDLRSGIGYVGIMEKVLKKNKKCYHFTVGFADDSYTPIYCYNCRKIISIKEFQIGVTESKWEYVGYYKSVKDAKNRRLKKCLDK